MCTHMQYTLLEQSITVTIIDDDTCSFLRVSAHFFFLPLVDGLCCRSFKRESYAQFFTLVISGFCGHFNEALFFITLIVMLWR